MKKSLNYLNYFEMITEIVLFYEDGDFNIEYLECVVEKYLTQKKKV